MFRFDKKNNPTPWLKIKPNEQVKVSDNSVEPNRLVFHEQACSLGDPTNTWVAVTTTTGYTTTVGLFPEVENASDH